MCQFENGIQLKATSCKLQAKCKTQTESRAACSAKRVFPRCLYALLLRCLYVLCLFLYSFDAKTGMARNYILDQETVARKLQRIAYEIIENNLDEKHIILAGIRENGSVIARNIEKLLLTINPSISIWNIDISLDKKAPHDIKLSGETDFTDKVIIVIDDVANSGKTMLYAIKPFLAYLPKKIQTLALVERTHKAYPVNTDYVGLSVATTLQEHIFVEVEGDVVTGAYLE
jgi:pyrimidine operon attenuation protein / uracil phosphoribosyltransferase